MRLSPKSTLEDAFRSMNRRKGSDRRRGPERRISHKDRRVYNLLKEMPYGLTQEFRDAMFQAFSRRKNPYNTDRRGQKES